MSPLGLFEGVGVEIEYMIVDRSSSNVRPVCDRLIEAAGGEPAADVARGDIAWSNELALHVLELKTSRPVPDLGGLSGAFHREIVDANAYLEAFAARLLPGGTHPWMNPYTETRIWPHENTEVYRAFDRIFDCSGHGWSNLQSTHINLPFDRDETFERLHSAIRFALPLIPGISAASPFLDGDRHPALDARLVTYASNASRIPEVSGRVVPDVARSESEYRERILAPLYRALHAHDPAGVLKHEWVNARGAIARFDRDSIEIRVIDAQESPASDIAVVVGLVRALVEERWAPLRRADEIDTNVLSDLLHRAAHGAEDTVVHEAEILRALGRDGSSASLGRIWRDLCERLAPDLAHGEEWGRGLDTILSFGTLGSRMVRRWATGIDLPSIALELAECAEMNAPFPNA